MELREKYKHENRLFEANKFGYIITNWPRQ